MKEAISDLCRLLLSIFLLPFLITLILQGDVILNHYLSQEERYLPIFLSTEISPNAPQEAAKAQAIITRTNYRVACQEGAQEEIYQVLLSYYGRTGNSLKLLRDFPKYRECLREATQVLTYQGQICWVPYHRISSGTTRDGTEALHSQEYQYLTSVDSSFDRENEEYLSSYEFPRDYWKEMTIQGNDKAGYVTQVQVGTEIISGEELRKQLQLSSSAFSFQNEENNLKILCKGRGHGLGMSQSGAEYLAENGQNYIEILYYYFPQMEISE